MKSFFQLFLTGVTVLVSVMLCGPTNSFSALSPDVVSLTTFTSSLNTPVRLAADSAGSLYVSDPRGGGIVKLDNSGKYQTTISVNARVLGIAVALSGDILVSQGTTVAVYSASGTKLKEFGSFGKANGIAITKNGDIFVVDSFNHNVQAFTVGYAPKMIGASNSFGSPGTAPGQFRQPTGISYEKLSGQLAVVDTRNGRIQFFSTAGVFQKSIGSLSIGYGPDAANKPLFRSPQAVSFEYNADNSALNRIYVVDTFQSTIYVLDGSTGDFVRFVGNYGITNSKLLTPSDIFIDSSNRLIVANGTGKLTLFGIADPTTNPFLLVNALPQATNLSSLVVSGTTTGTSVTVNGLPAALHGSDWSATVNLVQGVNNITVVASSAGGSTTKSATVTALAPAANPVALTINPVTSPTSQATLALAGTVTSGSSVTVNGSAATVIGTNWSFVLTLTNGLNSIAVVGSKVGMDTTNITIPVTLDTSVPVLASHLPTAGSVFRTPLQTVSGTVSSSNAATVVVTVNRVAQTVPVTDGMFSVPVILHSGSNIIDVVAVDAKGASSVPLATTVVYDPSAPQLIISTPVGAVSGSPTYRLTGSVPAGSSVTVNGVAAAISGTTTWTADMQLVPGFNGFEVKATAPGGATSTAMSSVAYAAGLPSLVVTSPPRDVAVASKGFTVSGTAQPGSIVTARVNGNPVSVATNSSGVFSFALPAPAAVSQSYSVIVDVTDTFGTTATTMRSILYDPVPPTVLVDAANLQKFSTTASVLIARDKNGAVGSATIANGITILDLSNVVYDATTLNVQALSAAGLSSRTGDLTGDKKLDIGDALKALRISAKLDAVPPVDQMLTGDVAPMVAFESRPDGKIGIDDVVVILNKVLGIIP